MIAAFFFLDLKMPECCRRSAASLQLLSERVLNRIGELEKVWLLLNRLNWLTQIF